MLIDDVHPSTIEGVKSLASQLRKREGIKHSAALDLAARAANCPNFKSAQRILPARGSALANQYVLLTAYWCDNDKRYQAGRETLRIPLVKPILETCPEPALKQVRGFGDLRMVAPDHFVCDAVASSQTAARERLSTAERSLRFMESTGLQPTRDYRKAYPGGRSDDKLPNSDHATDWSDPTDGQFILVDEPYRGVPNQEKRAAWAARTGWRVVKTSWPGMYNPHKCHLYVAVDGRSGYDLAALAAKIDAMPAPLLEGDWAGESAPMWETFISPMAKTPQDMRRARSRGTIYPAASKTSVPYSYNPGSTRRRPAVAMPVEGHIEAGHVIKAVLQSGEKPYGVNRRMDAVRSTLEDWMSIEIGRGVMEGPEFFDVYYHETDDDGPYFERARTREGVAELLRELKRKLQAAYPDCAPLRQQIHRIDVSLSLIGKMKLTDE